MRGKSAPHKKIEEKTAQAGGGAGSGGSLRWGRYKMEFAFKPHYKCSNRRRDYKRQAQLWPVLIGYPCLCPSCCLVLTPPLTTFLLHRQAGECKQATLWRFSCYRTSPFRMHCQIYAKCMIIERPQRLRGGQKVEKSDREIEGRRERNKGR